MVGCKIRTVNLKGIRRKRRKKKRNADRWNGSKVKRYREKSEVKPIMKINTNQLPHKFNYPLHNKLILGDIYMININRCTAESLLTAWRTATSVSDSYSKALQFFRVFCCCCYFWLPFTSHPHSKLLNFNQLQPYAIASTLHKRRWNCQWFWDSSRSKRAMCNV